MNIDQAKHTFLEESIELLGEMESSLLTLERDPEDEETLNALFRAAHTIKGSGGLFGFDDVVDFTHVLENVLGKVREGGLAIDPALSALLLQCRDHIGVLVQAAVADEALDAATTAAGAQLLAALQGYLDGETGAAAGEAAGAAGRAEDCPEAICGPPVVSDTWHISVRFDQDVLRNGMDPLSFLRFLGTLGDLVYVTTLYDALPDAEAMDPEACYLGFEIDLRSDADKQAIEEVFQFVEDACQLRILPPHSALRRYVEVLEATPEDEDRLGALLVQSGALTARELEQALALQQTLNAEAGAGAQQHRLGEVLVGQKVVEPKVVEAALGRQSRARETRGQQSKYIRVDADRLSQLINLVGELVIASANTQLLAQRLADSGLLDSVSVFSHLVEEIRDNALALRMVQIGETFNRFQRVVHDVSLEMGKEIDLVVSGAETELDKALVERIGDPLMHLVRNAIDHGIEAPEIREAAGKPRHGSLRLNAYHDSGSIVIQVADDGKGIDRERVLEKARNAGLVQPQQHLPDPEVLRLVFEPGLSTAAQVTDLSGRGVGMDVVKRGIEALRGSVDVDSELGQGTTMTIRLPLTLAIIDGFLVGVGESNYVIPLDTVVECLELSAAEQKEIERHHYVNLRGEVLPLLDMRGMFGEHGTRDGRQNVVVVQYAGQKAGLLVDTLHGEFQTVIKPMGAMFEKLAGISGATILGSGEVALILDVQSLTQRAEDVPAGHREAVPIG